MRAFKPIYGVWLINLIGFALLYFNKKSVDRTTFFVCFTMMAIIGIVYFYILMKRLGDEYIFLIVSMLSSLGVIMIFRLDSWLGIKQIIWFLGGIILFMTSYFAYLRYNIGNKLIYFYMGSSLFLFLLTIIFGRDIKGANNWIVIGPINFQPSEIIKVLYILFLASYFSNPESLNIPEFSILNRRIKINNEYVFVFASFCFIGFLVLQREWGSALLFFLVYFILLFIYRRSFLLLMFNGALACIGGIVGYMFLFHIRVRVDMWINPWEDISGKGYQITQSLFAIGAGGFFGKGLGLGKPYFIPEAQTDFIFSAICEEMGIFGGIAIILLFYILIYRGFKISILMREPFNKAVALGITLMLGFQTFIIVGGVTKLTPLTGITLPFISYGGSSLISSFISLGILQAISKKSY